MGVGADAAGSAASALAVEGEPNSLDSLSGATSWVAASGATASDATASDSEERRAVARTGEGIGLLDLGASVFASGAGFAATTGSACGAAVEDIAGDGHGVDGAAASADVARASDGGGVDSAAAFPDAALICGD
mmetsp:Transcript_17480/g.36105  ORF Transcript_17480/g.36105 Transcript_17480/m.36105 type:complete len:134 (-) Transcript_17480:39-440(-)